MTKHYEQGNFQKETVIWSYSSGSLRVCHGGETQPQAAGMAAGTEKLTPSNKQEAEGENQKWRSRLTSKPAPWDLLPQQDHISPDRFTHWGKGIQIFKPMGAVLIQSKRQ